VGFIAGFRSFELIPKVVTGVRFVDGEEQTQQALINHFNKDAPVSDKQHLRISRSVHEIDGSTLKVSHEDGKNCGKKRTDRRIRPRLLIVKALRVVPLAPAFGRD
jgi:hypothetical protein